MAFFLPFIITFDILKKTITLSEKGHSEIILPEGFKKNKFILQMAGINGFCTVSFVFAMMLGLHFGLPELYNYNGAVLAVLLGLTAGLFSVLFTYMPIRKLKKYHLPDTGNTPEDQPQNLRTVAPAAADKPQLIEE
ncbi:hypothetical protein [Pedobacter lusitanus]|nr:hypothetical protein [Pedobacter lusitanus]